MCENLRYTQISQVMYQPKSVGKMSDFENFDLMCLPKFKPNVYYCLGYRVCSVPGQKFNFQPSSVFRLIYCSHLIAMGLTSCEIQA